VFLAKLHFLNEFVLRYVANLCHVAARASKVLIEYHSQTSVQDFMMGDKDGRKGSSIHKFFRTPTWNFGL
jgi:hypothetical protein